MQNRHRDPAAYFEEAAASCRKYYIPYIEECTDVKLGEGCRVLEVGSGTGGVLSAFARRGCRVTGVDRSRGSIELARDFFAKAFGESAANGEVPGGVAHSFVSSDVFDYRSPHPFDLIVLHDALEHIPEKERLLLHLGGLLADRGVIWFGFPPWQMPFGGHQQMSRSQFVSHCPWIHLLPAPLFRLALRTFGEKESTVASFMDIRRTRITVEQFERLAARTGFETLDRRLWLINPHYEVKFGVKARVLPPLLARVPHLRNYIATTCYYLLRKSVPHHTNH